MGSITISAVTSAGTVSKAFPIADANIIRLAVFGRSVARMGPGDPAPDTLTNAQALEHWMKWALEISKDRVEQYERHITVLPNFGIG